MSATFYSVIENKTSQVSLESVRIRALKHGFLYIYWSAWVPITLIASMTTDNEWDEAFLGTIGFFALFMSAWSATCNFRWRQAEQEIEHGLKKDKEIRSGHIIPMSTIRKDRKGGYWIDYEAVGPFDSYEDALNSRRKTNLL